jgi:diaminopimelate decarboxylase
MSSVQTASHESEKGGDGRGVVGSIRSLARRLSGTFVGSRNLPHLSGQGKDKRNPIFSYDDESGQLKVGGVPVQELAENFKTPLYVYDVNRIVENYDTYIKALTTSVANNNFLLGYGVKANPSLGILDLFKRLGQESETDESGGTNVAFNCTTFGEIARVQSVGVDVSTSVIFSGPGKTIEEIESAVQNNIYLFNVESLHELEQIETSARKLNKEVNISIRVNPEISSSAANADGPSPIQARFGVALKEVVEMAVRAKASAFLKVKGLSIHLQISGTAIEPYVEARDKLLNIAETLRNESRIFIEHINLGGGFPVGLGADLPVWIEKLTRPISERGLKVIICP